MQFSRSCFKSSWIVMIDWVPYWADLIVDNVFLVKLFINGETDLAVISLTILLFTLLLQGISCVKTLPKENTNPTATAYANAFFLGVLKG